MKKLLLSAVLCAGLYTYSCANVNSAVQNMLGSSEYNTHKNLINHIFKNESSFYTNGKVDYVKVSQTLQNNNILNLKLGSTTEIDVDFYFTKNATLAIKNLSDILKQIGHQEFIATKQAQVGDQILWSIKVKTAAAINPLRLSSELKEINSQVLDIKKEGPRKFSYFINTNNSSVFKAEDLENNSEVSLRRSLKPHFLKLGSASNLRFSSNSGNSWHPRVVFYDKNFNIIDIYEENSLKTSVNVVVPSGTRFVKIDDIYSLINLKNGLKVTKG